MNREEFAKRLDGIQIQEGTDPKILYDSVLPICDALTQMMPQSLFRYRSCTEKTRQFTSLKSKRQLFVVQQVVVKAEEMAALRNR